MKNFFKVVGIVLLGLSVLALALWAVSYVLTHFQ